MKTIFRFAATAGCACAAVLSFVSCERAGDADAGQGTLSIHFSEPSYQDTKASENIPDTSDFILTVASSDGTVLYSGKYGDSPEKLIVSAGSYDVSVRSGTFSKPAFSAPLFGDDQCAVVSSGKVTDVYLACVQMNAGIRLRVASNFLTSYPDGSLLLKAAEGKLLYSYSEKRIAYFNPGAVSLVLSNGGEDKTLCTKTLKERQVLVLSLSAPSSSSSSSGAGIHIAVDTSRTWLDDSYTIGGGSSSSGGGTYSDALSVAEAKSEIGAEDVWVYGYIVGGDLTSSSISFEVPFSSNTNMAIAGRTSVDDKEACMSVQLLKGEVRDALNLVENPDNLKRKVYLKGDVVESYYGIPGIKNISDYRLE